MPPGSNPEVLTIEKYINKYSGAAMALYVIETIYLPQGKHTFLTGGPDMYNRGSIQFVTDSGLPQTQQARAAGGVRSHLTDYYTHHYLESHTIGFDKSRFS